DPSEEVPTNFIFKGPPGTGKKTVARALGKLYFDMGLLSTPDMIECTASDLIDRYVGHTGPDTKAQLDNAQGKVLFIDVACRLIDGATEAVNELSHLLRSQKYSRNMVVILAGYEADMNKLMRIRLELSCLFQEEIIFEHIKPENCLELLARELSPKGIDASILQDTVSKNYVKIMRLVRVLSIFPSWSNARDIKNLA
ncbi:P-loop containing nucleoside triphosphate hydrolase protein, partial [Tuber borchii]